MRMLGRILGVAVLAALAGCKQPDAELLLAYSGDCQAYFEPCG